MFCLQMQIKERPRGIEAFGCFWEAVLTLMTMTFVNPDQVSLMPKTNQAVTVTWNGGKASKKLYFERQQQTSHIFLLLTKP